MINTVKKASSRRSTLNYAKSRVKVPTLAGPGYKAPKSTFVDYTALTPLRIGGYEGPLALAQPKRPKKPRL
jgi:hypothetical protein